MAARRALAGAVVVGLVLAMLAPAAALGADPQHGVKPLPAVDRAPWQTGIGPAHADPPRPPAAGRVIVRFRPGATVAAKARARAAIVGHTEAPLRPRARPRARRHRPPGRRGRPARRAAPGRRVRGARPGHHRLADAQRPGAAAAVGLRPAGRRRHRRQGRVEHDHRRPGRGRRGHRLRHAAQPRRPRRRTCGRTRARSPATGSTTTTTGTSTTSTAGTSSATTTCPTTTTGTGRTSPARSPRSATTASASSASRTRAGSCRCASSTPTARATCPTRSGRSTTRRATASASRTTAGATRAPPPRSCTTRSRPRAPRASWSSPRPATRRPTST